jgi:superfamily II DNA helicase RecQ
MTAKILTYLQRMLNNPHAKFKSIEQAKALVKILNRKEDLLVVLPTGGGKSLLFMLPAIMEKGKVYSIKS